MTRKDAPACCSIARRPTSRPALSRHHGRDRNNPEQFNTQTAAVKQESAANGLMTRPSYRSFHRRSDSSAAELYTEDDSRATGYGYPIMASRAASTTFSRVIGGK